MLHSLGIVLVAGAATIITAGAAFGWREWRRAVQITRRNEAFGQRFARSGFVERGDWAHAHTHPAPLDTRD